MGLLQRYKDQNYLVNKISYYEFKMGSGGGKSEPLILISTMIMDCLVALFTPGILRTSLLDKESI